MIEHTDIEWTLVPSEFLWEAGEDGVDIRDLLDTYFGKIGYNPVRTVCKPAAEPSTPTIVVKKLEWEQLGHGYWSGTPNKGEARKHYIPRYSVMLSTNGMWMSGLDGVYYADLEEAKSACQADYEQRTLSGIVETNIAHNVGNKPQNAINVTSSELQNAVDAALNLLVQMIENDPSETMLDCS